MGCEKESEGGFATKKQTTERHLQMAGVVFLCCEEEPLRTVLFSVNDAQNTA